MNGFFMHPQSYTNAIHNLSKSWIGRNPIVLGVPRRPLRQCTDLQSSRQAGIARESLYKRTSRSAALTMPGGRLLLC